MPQFIFATCLSFILTGCVSTGTWPLWGPSPAETLFTAGLEEWRGKDGDPDAFEELMNQHPDSPFAAAAEALVDCGITSDKYREQNARMAERLQALEQRHAWTRQELENERQLNSELTGRLQELETNLEKFKQILIETEQYSP
jgi:hypothetical protein